MRDKGERRVKAYKIPTRVVTEQDWFAARPTGTEDVYKLYAESFRGLDHLRRIQEEAQALIAKALSAGK